MVTPLGNVFFIDEKVMALADIKLVGSMVESIVIEFDQGKFEEFFSSSSKSQKATRQYRRVSLGTRSQVSSETSPKVTCAIAHNASIAISNEVLKTSRVAHAAHINVF